MPISIATALTSRRRSGDRKTRAGRSPRTSLASSRVDRRTPFRFRSFPQRGVCRDLPYLDKDATRFSQSSCGPSDHARCQHRRVGGASVAPLRYVQPHWHTGGTPLGRHAHPHRDHLQPRSQRKTLRHQRGQRRLATLPVIQDLGHRLVHRFQGRLPLLQGFCEATNSSLGLIDVSCLLYRGISCFVQPASRRGEILSQPRTNGPKFNEPTEQRAANPIRAAACHDRFSLLPKVQRPPSPAQPPATSKTLKRL